MTQKSAEIITPPNNLRRKIGGGMAKLDMAAIARAEQALQELSKDFDTWILDEAGKLEEARVAAEAAGWTVESRLNVRGRAHDLKGLGATYGYPLVTEFCGVLCRMLEHDKALREAPSTLLNASVQSVLACVRQRIKSSDHPVGRALLAEIHAKAGELMAEEG